MIVYDILWWYMGWYHPYIWAKAPGMEPLLRYCTVSSWSPCWRWAAGSESSVPFLWRFQETTQNILTYELWQKMDQYYVYIYITYYTYYTYYIYILYILYILYIDIIIYIYIMNYLTICQTYYDLSTLNPEKTLWHSAITSQDHWSLIQSLEVQVIRSSLGTSWHISGFPAYHGGIPHSWLVDFMENPMVISWNIPIAGWFIMDEGGHEPHGTHRI